MTRCPGSERPCQYEPSADSQNRCAAPLRPRTLPQETLPAGRQNLTFDMHILRSTSSRRPAVIHLEGRVIDGAELLATCIDGERNGFIRVKQARISMCCSIRAADARHERHPLL